MSHTDTLASDRQTWLTERSRITGVGASESAALFGLHPNISAFSLFEKLVNPRDLSDEEIEEESDVMAFGLAIEPYLADWYQRKTGRLVLKPAQILSRLKNRPYIFSSLDREYEQEEHDPEPLTGALELKSAIYFRVDEPVPDHWQVQVQQQMLCAGLKIASFAILGGFRRRYHVDDIPANQAFQEILVETIDRFMNAVQLGSWGAWGGDIEGSKATTEALKRLYKNESGETVQLSEEACNWADVLAFAKKSGKEAEAQETLVKNKLMAAIGSATFAVLPDGRKFSLKTQAGSTYEVVRVPSRVLRRMKGSK